MLSIHEPIAGQPFPLPVATLRDSIEPGELLHCCRHCGSDEITECYYLPFKADVITLSQFDDGRISVDELANDESVDGDSLTDPRGRWFCLHCNTQGDDETLVFVRDGIEIEPTPRKIAPTANQLLDMFGGSSFHVIADAPIRKMAEAYARHLAGEVIR